MWISCKQTSQNLYASLLQPQLTIMHVSCNKLQPKQTGLAQKKTTSMTTCTHYCTSDPETAPHRHCSKTQRKEGVPLSPLLSTSASDADGLPLHLATGGGVSFISTEATVGRCGVKSSKGSASLVCRSTLRGDPGSHSPDHRVSWNLLLSGMRSSSLSMPWFSGVHGSVSCLLNEDRLRL